MSTTLRKWHCKPEIAAKLVQADDLARHGEFQRQIARTLGVSVMTLHRWRKIRSENATLAAPEEVARFEEELGSSQRLSELELDNSRLRRITWARSAARRSWPKATAAPICVLPAYRCGRRALNTW
jgi:hypothetical protein